MFTQAQHSHFMKIKAELTDTAFPSWSLTTNSLCESYPTTQVAKFQKHRSAGKVMLHTFLKWQGIMNHKFIPECALINEDTSTEVLIIYE
jgi:hypothetical protein